MSFTVSGPSVKRRKIQAGGESVMEISGHGVFSTTDKTGSIPTGFRTIENIQLTCGAATTGLDVLYGLDAGGGIVTVGRDAASPTSGMKVYFRITGY